MTQRYAIMLAVVASGLVLATGSARADFAGGSSTPAEKPAAAESTFAQADRLVKAQRYTEAVPLLERTIIAEPKNADAFNDLGFSYRKLGKHQRALENYRKALDIDPHHLGANEYLGELYLEMNDLPAAEARLAELTRLCPRGCEQRDDLRHAVDAFKKKPRS